MKRTDLKKLEAKLTRQAQASIAKSGKLQIRFNPEDIQRVYKAAERNKKRVSELVRDWILEALNAEENSRRMKKVKSNYSRNASDRDAPASLAVFEEKLDYLISRIDKIEKKVD